MRRIIDKKVEEVMTKDVITVTKETSLKELKDLYEKYDFNAFPVMEKDDIVGVVAKIDFLKIFSFDPDRLVPDLKSMFAKNVGDIMSRGIYAVCVNDSIQKAAQLMLKKRIRAVLVTDKSKKELRGIITRGNIVEFVELD